MRSLTKPQLLKLADAVREVSFRSGDVIIRKGDIGDALFFITDGLVKCTDIGTGTTAVAVTGNGGVVAPGCGRVAA